MQTATMSQDERTETIAMVRDAARALLDGAGGVGRARALRFGNAGFDRGVWAEMAANGWIGLRLPEDQGGAGLGTGALCALAVELGAALAPEPLLPAMLSASLLAAAGQREDLEALLAGRTHVVTAWQERPGELAAPGSPDRDRVFLPLARTAEAFLLPVREGHALYLRRLSPSEVALDIAATQDGGHYGMLRAPRGGLAICGDVAAALDQALDEAALGTAAMLLGLMDRALALTVDHLKVRSQFGRVIGSFQALQHRAVDLHLQVALSRASIEAAAAELDSSPTPARRRAAVSRAKARASDAAMLVCRQAIQLHGGIGYTDEHDIGLYLRRAMVLSGQFGSAGWHRRRFLADVGHGEET